MDLARQGRARRAGRPVRKEFDVDSDVKSAVLFGSCDNQLRVYLNGEDVAASEA